MSRMSGRVWPEQLVSTNEVENGLPDSSTLRHEKEEDNFIVDDMQVVYDDHEIASESQEGLDDFPEEQTVDSINQFHNGNIDHPGSHPPKHLQWSTDEAMASSKRSHTCDRVILLAVCFMSAVSIVLTLLMFLGVVEPFKCACSGKTDAAKPEKQTEVPFNAQEIKAEITKLQGELNNARQELQKLKKTSDSKIENLRKELQQMKNCTPVGTAKNVTTKVTNSTEKADKVSFELMLNSSQQIVMKMLSEISSSLNTSDKERHEDTASLRLMGNSTQAQIQKVSDNLKKLEAKFQMEENETMQFKERHSDDVASLTMSINNTKMDVIDMLTQMWKSLNSTGKGQQDNTLWAALNNTKVDLQQKINNVGKIAGPVGPPGLNGSQGPAGPPGPKGAGDFSTCQYKVKTEDGGGDQMAHVDEPTGHIIIAATCSTNYAEDIEFRSGIVVRPKRRYICDCKGVKNSRKNPKNCSLHYWICSKT